MKASIEQIKEMVPLIMQLWPDNTMEEAENILREYICSEETEVFTQVMNERYVGVALCALRHGYVEGCDTSPVGYLEGIVVEESYRKKGVANSLCKECEDWARGKGCIEFASDCEWTNDISLQFHLKIGFKEENRIICFRKKID